MHMQTTSLKNDLASNTSALMVFHMSLIEKAQAYSSVKHIGVIDAANP